jgi:hypothetical protein
MTLLRKIEIFMREQRIAPTRFGREAARDPRLIFDFRRGRKAGRKLTARIEAYMKGAVQ